MRPSSSGLAQWVLIIVLAVGVGGCAGLSGSLRGAADLPNRSADPPPSVTAAVEIAAEIEEIEPANAAEIRTVESALPQITEDPSPADARPAMHPAADGDPVEVAQQTTPSQRPSADIPIIEEYDPWEPFNEVTFEFNRGLDRWVVKPVAKGYNYVMPNLLQEMIGNGFDNIRFVPRLVNSLLQGKFGGAGRELARFLINSTLGIGGLFDIARTEFGIRKSNEDAGQTLGVWGAGPGPYLILPFLPPLTVRDAIGYAADMAMDPLSYVLPLFWDRAGMKVGDTINDRSFNLDLYQGFEEATVEFYSALRNAYLQRRLKLIKE